MTTMVAELYDALRKAGVDEDTARAAAGAVLADDCREHLATKTDLLALKADLHALESTLTWRMVTVMVAMTAVFSAIVKLA